MAHTLVRRSKRRGHRHAAIATVRNCRRACRIVTGARDLALQLQSRQQREDGQDS